MYTGDTMKNEDTEVLENYIRDMIDGWINNDWDWYEIEESDGWLNGNMSYNGMVTSYYQKRKKMNRFYTALLAKYQAEIEECVAVLDLYFSKSVGVGEHPDILSVLDEYTERLDCAKSKLDILKQLFPQNAPEPETNN